MICVRLRKATAVYQFDEESEVEQAPEPEPKAGEKTVPPPVIGKDTL